MAYGIKYKLNICDKDRNALSLYILENNYSGASYNVAGSATPIKHSYKERDEHFKTSYLTLEIYKDYHFNLDSLKTFDEKKFKVEFRRNGGLKFVGFLLPDFLTESVKESEAIQLTATDRLSTLKSVAIPTNQGKTKIIKIISDALKETGLSLPIKSLLTFDVRATSIYDHFLNAERLINAGKPISAYDVLLSFLVATNSTLLQKNGEWHIINNYEKNIKKSGSIVNYDTNGNLINQTAFTTSEKGIDKIGSNSIRQIQAPLSKVSIYQEFGGAERQPVDYNFASYPSADWSLIDGYKAEVATKEPISFDNSTSKIVFSEQNSNKRRVLIKEFEITPEYLMGAIDPIKRLRSRDISIGIDGDVNLTFNVSAIGGNKKTMLLFVFMLSTTQAGGNGAYFLTPNGFVKASDKNGYLPSHYTIKDGLNLEFYDDEAEETELIQKRGTFDISLTPADFDLDSLRETYITMNVMKMGANINEILLEELSVRINESGNQANGLMYEIGQGAGAFSKESEPTTTIFGDYLTRGVNGDLYPYTKFELSNLINVNGGLVRGGWTDARNEKDYLLLLSATQKAILNSNTRDILRTNFDLTEFDILSNYTCKGRAYEVMNATYDYFNQKLDTEIIEIATSGVGRLESVYSYFGTEGVKGVSGLSKVSSGTGGGGGSSPQYWQLDEDGNLFTEYNAYSTKELSAYGLGSGSGGGGDGTHVEWGATANNYSPLTVEGISKTVALLGHTHTKTEIGLGNVLNVASYSKIESDERFAPLIALNSHVNDNIRHITGAERAKWDGVVTDFAGLEIGGRNLLLNSKVSVTNNYHNRQTLYLSEQTIAGQRYTFSIKCDDLKGGELSINDDATLNHIGRLTFISGNIYGVAFNAVDSFSRIRVRNTGNRDNPITTHEAKLEKGTKPTDWSPAPEDQVSDWLTTDVNSFSFIKNKPTKLSDFADNIGIGAHIANNVIHITGQERINWNDANTKKHTHPNKSVIDQLTQANIDVLAKLSLVNGNLKVDTNLYSTGEVSAYGLGSGSGGGGGSLVSWGTTANNFSPLTVEGISKTVALQGHTHTKAEVGLSNVLNVASYSKAETDTLLAGKFNNPTGTTSQYIRGDGSLATYANTTYTTGTLAQLNAGTDTTGRLQTAKLLNDWLNGKNYYNSRNLAGATVSSNYEAENNEDIRLGGHISNYVTSSWLVNRPFTGYGGLIAFRMAPSYGFSGLELAYDVGRNAANGGRLAFRTVAGTGDSVNGEQGGYKPWKEISIEGHAHTFASITSKPTTISGYGITNGALTTTSIIAGNGLTGGGTLASDRTITLGTPSNITTATTNSVTVSSHTHNLALGGTSSQYLNGATALVTIPTITAGNGLTGGGQLTDNRTLTLGTPSTLTASTTNEVTTNSHTHSITTTTTGAANTIVQTDSEGRIIAEALYAMTDIIAGDFIQSNGAVHALYEMQSPVYKLGNGWDIRASGTEIQFFYNGVKKGGFSTNGFYSTGEITAYE